MSTEFWIIFTLASLLLNIIILNRQVNNLKEDLDEQKCGLRFHIILKNQKNDKDGNEKNG